MDNLDTYFQHYNAAKHLLTQAESADAEDGTVGDLLAAAQVHATLAQAVATTRMVDTYDGWHQP